MRKTLLSILLLALCPLLFGALQTLPVPIVWNPLMHNFSVGGSTLTINGTDELDEIALLASIPATGTLTDIQIATGTITTAETAVPFRIETVGTDGNPSGSLYDAAGTGTVDIAAADDEVAKTIPINGGTGITVTVSNQVFVRWKRKAASPALVGAFRYANLGSIAGHPSIRDFNITGAGVWTKSVGSPMLSMKIGGAWYVPPYCAGGVTGATTTEAFQTTVEKGIGFNWPVSVRLVGAVANVFSATANTFKYAVISTPLGTAAQAAITPTLDSDVSPSAAGVRHTAGLFTAPFTTTASTGYMVSVIPQEAVNISLAYWPADATYRTAFPTGTFGTWYTRATGGTTSFTEVTSPVRVPFIGLIIDAIDSGSSGGKFISEGLSIDSIINQWDGPRYTRKVIWAGN